MKYTTILNLLQDSGAEDFHSDTDIVNESEKPLKLEKHKKEILKHEKGSKYVLMFWQQDILWKLFIQNKHHYLPLLVIQETTVVWLIVIPQR